MIARCNLVTVLVTALVVHVDSNRVPIGIGGEVGTRRERVDVVRLSSPRTAAGNAVALTEGGGSIAPGRAAKTSRLLQLVGNLVGIPRGGRSHRTAAVSASSRRGQTDEVGRTLGARYGNGTAAGNVSRRGINCAEIDVGSRTGGHRASLFDCQENVEGAGC